MKTLFKRNTIIFIFAVLIIATGFYLLATSPIGDAFVEGFKDGYNDRKFSR